MGCKLDCDQTAGGCGTSWTRRLQQRAELTCVTAMREEAVRIMAVGQAHDSNRNVCTSELRGQTSSGLGAAAVGVAVESQIDSSMAAAQLLKLACVQMVSQRASDVLKAGLPEHGVVE